MSAKNTVTVRATLRAVSCTSAEYLLSGLCSSPAGVTTELEMNGDHGRIVLTLGSKLPAWLTPFDDLEHARFEVTLRRLRKAPRKGKAR